MTTALHRPLVGILGASGAVGKIIARRLAPNHALRLAGRREAALQALALSNASIHAFELSDKLALAQFCQDCDVVVNATGPSHLYAQDVQTTIRQCGAHGVDVAGDAQLLSVLEKTPAPKACTTILGAGQAPGLTGLLPRMLLQLAGSTGQAGTLVCYCGGLEAFTPTSASEFARSLGTGYGTPMASWRAGALRRHEALPHTVSGPDQAVQALPFLPGDLERLAQTAPVAELRYYHLIAGHALLHLLGQPLPTNTETLARQIREAADADLHNATPWQRMQVFLSAMGQRWRCELHAVSGYALSGEVAAWSAARLARKPQSATIATEWFDAWADPVACWSALSAAGVFEHWHLGASIQDEQEGSL